jgi:putative DNA primase/helicase
MSDPTSRDLSRPELLPFNRAGAPAELAARDQWVCFRLAYRPGQTKPWTKVPINPRTGGKASSTNPATWGTIDQALARLSRDRLDGVGYVFSAEDPYAGIDRDSCRDPKTGEILSDALDLVRRFGSYAEPSVTGTGLHIIVRADFVEGNKRGPFECYSRGRFFAFTGQPLPGLETIEDRNDEVNAWRTEAFAKPQKARTTSTPQPPSTPIARDTEAILGTVRRTDKGRRLHDAGDWKGCGYPSQSDADLALCDYYVAAGADRRQADDLFRRSGLMRDKWDERHSGDGRTYGDLTLTKAFDGSVRLFDVVARRPALAPPGHDDHPPLDETIADLPCAEALTRALQELAAERKRRMVAEAERDQLLTENARFREKIEDWSDRWTREQKVRETPTVQPEADLINAAGWIYEATVDQPETYERPDGKRVFRRTKDGFVRVYRGELARKSGKSERTVTTQLAIARKLGIIEVKHEPERVIDPETSEIQTIPDSSVIYFRPRAGSVAEMHHRATSVTPEQRMIATGKKHLHGGLRPACPHCGSERRRTVCADCGHVFAEDLTGAPARDASLDFDPYDVNATPPGHHDQGVPTPTPLEKTAENSKSAPRPVVPSYPLDKMTRGSVSRPLQPSS